MSVVFSATNRRIWTFSQAWLSKMPPTSKMGVKGSLIMHPSLPVRLSGENSADRRRYDATEHLRRRNILVRQVLRHHCSTRRDAFPAHPRCVFDFEHQKGWLRADADCA